jgi:hypothetical protein
MSELCYPCKVVKMVKSGMIRRIRLILLLKGMENTDFLENLKGRDDLRGKFLDGLLVQNLILKKQIGD